MFLFFNAGGKAQYGLFGLINQYIMERHHGPQIKAELGYHKLVIMIIQMHLLTLLA